MYLTSEPKIMCCTHTKKNARTIYLTAIEIGMESKDGIFYTSPKKNDVGIKKKTREATH